MFEALEADDDEEDRNEGGGDDGVLRPDVLAVTPDERVERARDVGVVSVGAIK
jgi:hypothetical protein